MSGSLSCSNLIFLPQHHHTELAHHDELAPLTLDIKYVDSKYDEEKSAWEYEDTANHDVPAELVQPVGTHTTDENDSWDKASTRAVRRTGNATSPSPSSSRVPTCAQLARR